MRFSDNISKSFSPDFVPRAHNKPLKRLMILHAIIILITAICIYIMPSQASQFAGIIIITSIIGLAVFSFFSNQQNNDMRMVTEFENMLFSAATSLGSSFCFFIKSDSTIVYADDGTKKMFPRFAYDEGIALDNLLQEGKVDKLDAERIYAALSKGVKERLVFPITQSDGTVSEFIIMIEPLRRPAGYFVVRGRPYYPERKDSIKMQTGFGLASGAKIESLLSSLPQAIYITDERGIIEYANPALEKWLGYTENQILEAKLTIMKIIYEADGYSMGDFGISDYAGNVLLQHKNSSLSKATLKQYILRDDTGKVTGCCGILTDNDSVPTA